MSGAKRKKHANQPELPIQGATELPVEPKPTKKTVATSGNGAQHVIAEEVTATIAHRSSNSKKLEAGLHTGVDRGFLNYASYVICDRDSESGGRFETGAAPHSVTLEPTRGWDEQATTTEIVFP